MKIIITENQLSRLIEENDYFDYNNISNSDKELFYRVNAGFSPTNKTEQKKGKLLYIKAMKWTGGKLDDPKSFQSEFKRFNSVPLAKDWYNKQTYNKKYFKLIYVYDK